MKHGFVRQSIRFRLAAAMVVLMVAVLALVGVLLEWRVRDLLEAELGEKLTVAASAAAAQLDAELVLALRPGDEQTRTYRHLRGQLDELRRAMGMERLYAVDAHLAILAGADSSVSIGQRWRRLEMDRAEISRALTGTPASSVLFRGVDGRLYKSAYAPLRLGDKPRAVVAVEGSAQSLQAIVRLRSYLLRLGVVGALVALLLGVALARQITGPLARLRKAAETIGRGDYQVPVPLGGHDEIGFLAQTMEEMRRNVVERDTRLKTMLAGIAHELRNPLGGIELFAGLLAEELRGGEQEARAARIVREVQHLKAIVNDFLDYARPPSPQRRPCPLEEILNEVRSLLAEELSAKGTDFTWHTDGLTIFVDPQHAQQIFLNLARNSVQAMFGPGVIRVTARTVGRQVEVLFADTGCGIPPDAQGHLFEPFFTTRKTGTGLGLAIARSLCQANQGSIALRHSDSSGTVFVLRFPKADEGEAQ
ncbi:MAG: HAMP domain-containing histidine kinase [Calditrichaeota bacterium]|nr:HAMP domain-containing histidine kinase [Calditrichota bacterium]